MQRVSAGYGAGAVVLAALIGCASDPATVAPRVSSEAAKLGPASATACGSMLLYASAYNFIPILLNDRFERAYQRALSSVPNATALTNVTASEYWFWWVVGRTHCASVEGEAVR